MNGSIAVVGPGRMGLALAHALHRSGEVGRITVYGRRPEPPAHPLFFEGGARYVFGMEGISVDCTAVFLAVPDDAVPEVAHLVAAQGPAPSGCAAFHLSGSLPTDVLAPLHAAGYEVGAFHPWTVVSFAPGAQGRLRGAAVGVTASPEAFRVARDVASLIGAVTLPIPANRRPVCDAAVSLVAAALPVVIDRAARLVEGAGLDPGDAMPAMTALAGSVLAEVDAAGAPGALAEILGRADRETLAVHLRATEGDEQRLYHWIGAAAARLAGPELAPGARAELLDRLEERSSG